MFIQAQRQKFLAVVVTTIAFLLLDAVWIFVDNRIFGLSALWNWLINAGYYILSGVLGYLWFAYSETVQDSPLLRGKARFLSQLPLVLLVAFTLLSFKTGWLFFIDGAGVYHRGPLYPLQLLCSYGYVIFTAVKAFALSVRTENYRNRQDYRTLAIFVLPTLLAGVVQVAVPGYPVLCVGNTLGILYVFTTMQEQLVSVDALTKLNNRNQLLQYLSLKFQHPSETKALYLLLMDIDYFKLINDGYGHVEGDEALKTVADCLKKACGTKHHFIARYGGDEFVILCELAPSEEVQHLCGAIHAELKKIKKPYALSLSIGCARYTPELKTQQQFIAKADAELYKIKKSRK